MAKKIRWKTLILCIAVPLIVGGLSSLITHSAMERFMQLRQPPLSPPSWVFPVVWTILYVLMGIASYLALTSGAAQKSISTALKFYGAQLFFNFFWTIIYFNLGQLYFAFVWLVALWVLILITLILFSRLSKPAAYLLIPYLVWVSFAGYLNLATAILN